MNITRDAILVLTICSLIYIADNWPKPVHDNQVPYCVVSVYQGGFDEQGQLHTAWAPMYRPCSEQDEYKYI